MITLISIVVLSQPARPTPVVYTATRHVVFSERIRFALGEAWRVLIG